MDSKPTVSQTARANRLLMTKILAAPLPWETCAGNSEQQEAYNMVMLHRRQDAGGGVVAALPASESAVLALFA